MPDLHGRIEKDETGGEKVSEESRKEIISEP
jgi:hypothetical protein